MNFKNFQYQFFLFPPIKGKAKKTRKFAEVKRMISPKDARLWETQSFVQMEGTLEPMENWTNSPISFFLSFLSCSGRETRRRRRRRRRTRERRRSIRCKEDHSLSCGSQEGKTRIEYLWNFLGSRWLPRSSSSTTPHWVPRITSSWIPTSSISRFRTSWISCSRWWIAFTQSVWIRLVGVTLPRPDLLVWIFRTPAGTPYISDCVMAELEKLGPRYRVALKYFPPIMFPARPGFFNISLVFS